MKEKITVVLIMAGLIIFSTHVRGGEHMYTDEYLKNKLTEEQFNVTRKNATEPPFLNKYWNNKEEGLYVDVISGEPLFTSREKFDSSSGWPSFFAPLEKENIVHNNDTSHGMVRTEVRSKKSDAHLGHVFEDGPNPTGLRYCINSSALKFIKKDDLEKEGYGAYSYLFTKEKTRSVTETATFGAGCFWGVESAFEGIKGVVTTKVGYMGGEVKNPTYAQVCTDRTGHAEVVRVTYDPAQITYENLLEVFFRIHDPTTMNRQGPDQGSQYRSVVFYHSKAQEAAAKRAKDRIAQSGTYKSPVVTEIVPAQEFFPAEEYHQKYFKKQGGIPTCHIH